MTIHEGRDGHYVTFEKAAQWWAVQLRDGNGNLLDKVRCDTHSEAVQYRKSFLKIARTGGGQRNG
jgi:hypothetical protein